MSYLPKVSEKEQEGRCDPLGDPEKGEGLAADEDITVRKVELGNYTGERVAKRPSSNYLNS